VRPPEPLGHRTEALPSPAPPRPSVAILAPRPHVCNDGWITLGQIVVDPETGEEIEEFALYLCRRCAEEARV
jgi:hypothetical protein